MPTDPPIVCDMADAPDTPEQRLLDYDRLFATALVGRERTQQGIVFRFRADEAVEAQVRDLAAREKACCGFFTFAVTRVDDEIRWSASVVDDPIARQILDEFYRLPDTAHQGVEALEKSFADSGLTMINTSPRQDSNLRPAD